MNFPKHYFLKENDVGLYMYAICMIK